MAGSSISAYLRQIERDFKKKSVDAGFFESSKYADGTPVAYVAVIQEYGSKGKNHNIPARPFIRPTIDDHRQEWFDLIKSGIEYQVSADDIFDSLGLLVQGQIKESITNVFEPVLSPITLAIRAMREQNKAGFRASKGLVESVRRQLSSDNPPKLSSNTKPLNDTGHLLSSVMYRVQR